jgi:hypothetical protein
VLRAARPGYIAGVVNPMFAERMEWWDVLCDVATGKVTLNPNTMAQEKERLPHSKLDAEFFQRVPHARVCGVCGVCVRMRCGELLTWPAPQINSAVNSHYGDDYIKRQFEVSAVSQADLYRVCVVCVSCVCRACVVRVSCVRACDT